MATGEENENGGGYEDEPGDPQIVEDAELKENLNDDVEEEEIRLEDEEESAELEKEDLYLDPDPSRQNRLEAEEVDPSRQNRLEAEEDPDYYATYHYATINSVLSSDALSRLAQRIEKSKNAVFLRKMYGVWEDTCFVNDLRLTIEEDSPEDRVNCMKFDSCLKTGLKEIELNNTNQFPTAITIRLFLNILIAHWTDEEVLTGLEKKMGKDHFKETSQWIAERKAKVIAFNKQNVQWDHLTLTVKSIERAAEAIEDLRNVLTGKYGVENQNIEATLKRVKGQLNVILSVHNKHYGYDGGEVTFLLRGYDGRYDISSVVEE